MKRRTQHTIGRTRIRLAARLSKAHTEREGIVFNIAPEDLWVQQGAYRHLAWDLARWGCDVVPLRGRRFTISSWDTMSACLKHGFEIGGPVYGKSASDRTVTSKG